MRYVLISNTHPCMSEAKQTPKSSKKTSAEQLRKLQFTCTYIEGIRFDIYQITHTYIHTYIRTYVLIHMHVHTYKVKSIVITQNGAKISNYIDM